MKENTFSKSVFLFTFKSQYTRLHKHKPSYFARRDFGNLPASLIFFLHALNMQNPLSPRYAAGCRIEAQSTSGAYQNVCILTGL